MEGREDVAAPNHKMTRQGLLEQPILPVLVRLAAPNMVSTLAQTAVGSAESWYVGRLGTIPLAGLALAFPMFMLMDRGMFGIRVKRSHSGLTRWWQRAVGAATARAAR
jgi:Na+-driven multidrug efflux pump